MGHEILELPLATDRDQRGRGKSGGEFCRPMQLRTGEKTEGTANQPVPTVGLHGSPGRTRTSDRVVNSHLLYQLSYRGIAKITERLLPPFSRVEPSAAQ